MKAWSPANLDDAVLLQSIAAQQSMWSMETETCC